MCCNRLLYTGFLAFTLLVLPGVCYGGDDFAISSEVAAIEHPASSPSGKYILHVMAARNSKPVALFFEIRAKNGELVFRSTDLFYAHHMTYFLWDNADRVWVYSGDVGTFFWEQKGGEWKKYSYVDEDVAAPLFLKEKRPRRHSF